ncbi:PIG-L deacetylase family protein [Azospirillum griseum]|uniref:PIG-L family deacetylase n=1 Tax=Azospirillum griseum TaxID=2496639 RepID=A0A431VAX4_9PROT|nr:PIG-L deacetylase family protein [Azospirillum griseum]RTR15539.1 PIG-L family deacetylase [Azospirillum griseum]
MASETETVVGGPVLVVAPHGMDEVLGCGGTIARLTAANRRVEVLVLFGGGIGGNTAIRAAGLRVAALLGSEPPRYADFPENRSDTLPLLDVVGVVERTVTELRPAEVYVSHGGNLNIDHQTAFRAVATALRPVPGTPVRRLLAYEIPSSTDWAPPGFGEPYRPTCFVDIADHLDRKLAALDVYGPVTRPWPHARSRKAVEALARSRGASIGLAAAEAFVLLREVLVIDNPADKVVAN